jgi:hypothetical protein
VTGHYVDASGSSTVNLSRSPVLCIIVTARPLPPDAWAEVGRLASEIDRCARAITRHLQAAPGATPPPTKGGDGAPPGSDTAARPVGAVHSRPASPRGSKP